MISLILSIVEFIRFFMSARRIGKDGLGWGIIGIVAFLVPATIIGLVGQYFYATYGIQYERGEFWLYVSLGVSPVAGIIVAHIISKRYLSELPASPESEAESCARALKQFREHEHVTETCPRCGSLIHATAIEPTPSDTAVAVKLECKCGCINGTYRLQGDTSP